MRSDGRGYSTEFAGGGISLVSRRSGAKGAAANNDSNSQSISADGRYVAFDSSGSNLSPEDTLHDASVFRYQLLP